MSVTSRYREAWESFWRAFPGRPGGVCWDAEPALTAGVHIALFEPYLTEPDLPLIDLGCGNGTQTRFLAERFPQVIGADLAPAALDHARRADPAGAVGHRVLDGCDKTGVEALHAELGDTNVYMRCVLHHSDPEDRQALVDGVATLVGEDGRAFLLELCEAAVPVLEALAQAPDGPPPTLAPVLEHGLTPSKIADDAVPVHLAAAGLTIVASGERPLITTEYAEDGTRIELPSRWLIAGRGD